ncbi:MAG: hypothetical protein CMN17_16800 [Roseovarius sp.]|nr:hypothetical protein [Roseovarius sp.]MBK44652.1 hypothetical protein [Roseovarius sp.]|tara:strand:- start:808 stop:2217 length:1410 start_codon:yes stop_codon:yes gene_type:complete
MADGGFDKLEEQDRAHHERMGRGSIVNGNYYERGDYIPESDLAKERMLKGGVSVTSPRGAGIGTVKGRHVDTGKIGVTWADGSFGSYHASELTVVSGSARRTVTPPKPPLTFLSYQDMISLPDPEWLIEGLIVEQTSALLFGRSNSFKSFLGVDIACSVGTGHLHGSWHGAAIMDGGPVLYVATEGALGVAKQRIPGWYEAHEIPEKDRQDAVTLYPQEIALDDDNAVNDLLRSCAINCATREGNADWHDPSFAFKLVVIDIFGASMMGPETSDETARAWVRNINRIMREMKCAVLTIAHTGWADETRARMHTHFWGSFDTRLKAEGDKDSLTTVLSVDRHKDADSSGEWGFRMDKVTLPSCQTTLVPRLCDEVEVKQKRRVSGKPAVALQALSEALIDKGRTIAGPNYPSRPVVTLEEWRTMCQRHGLTDSDSRDTQRKTFNRAKTTLIERGLVKQFDNHAWKVEADE